MYLKNALRAATALTLVGAGAASAETITIGTVNNGDMITMQSYSDAFTAKTGHEVEWVVLEENVLRQRLTQDIASKGGQFDIMMIGMYEAPIWGSNGWLVSLDDLPESYDVEDIFESVRGGLSYDGTLYAAPFYAESTMVHYRTDLVEKAGMTMPEKPSWDEIRALAAAMTDRENDINGICLRGKAGWGENMALLTTMAHTFGGRWVDEEWQAQLDSDAWSKAINFYLEMMEESGPAGASVNGFNENLSLFRQGKCGMWMDATVAAGWLTGEREGTSSVVDGKVGWAEAPHAGMGKQSHFLWSWALAIPAGTQKVDAAKEFIAWATSREYQELLAADIGWNSVPPGTRKSLYENPEYTAPFAEMTLRNLLAADPNNATVDPVPYVGVQFAAFPEFAGIAGQVGQEMAAALAGQQTAEEALAKSQALTNEELEAAGYQ